MVKPPSSGVPERNVLVVEDDAVVALGLISYLEEFGAAVTWVESVEAALSLLSQGAAFDAAVVDLNLGDTMSNPVIDELLARGVFTVLCTGYDESSIDERFRSLPRGRKALHSGKDPILPEDSYLIIGIRSLA